jgi:hypothetical protein
MIRLQQNRITGNCDCAGTEGGTEKLASCGWDQGQIKIIPRP